MSAPGGSAPGGGGLIPGGICSQGGLLPEGGLLPGGVSAPRGGVCLRHAPLPVNRMTNKCKNITLATTSLRPVINQ